MRLGRILSYLLFTLTSLLCLTNKAGGSTPLSHINPMIGTGGMGHTFPGATTPFGMVQLSPSNDFTSWKRCAGYHYDDTIIKGFAHNHISGAGLSGLGDILLMPTCGELNLSAGSDDNPDSSYRSRFSHSKEKASVGYYSVVLDDYDILAELTATPRVGVHRYTFNRAGVGRVIIDPTHNLMEGVEGTSITKIDDRTIEGYKMVINGVSGRRKVYFVARFSKPFDRFIVSSEGETINEDSAKSPSVVGCVEFDHKLAGESLEVCLALSYTSQEGAYKNLAAEMRSFDTALLNAQAMWSEKIGRITIDSDDESFKNTFYTALYHCFVSPNLISDVDGNYSIEGRIFNTPNPQYSNFSTWDTYRALHPLFTLIEQKGAADMVNSLSSRYTQAGIELPVWECLGHDNICMIGYNSVPVIAEAILKKIEGVDIDGAYRAMLHSANSNLKHSPTYDVSGVDKYKVRSYVPGEIGCSVSKTVEYNYFDWSISRVAAMLGDTQQAEYYLDRSKGYRNLFNSQTGYLQPRLSNGKMISVDTTRWSPLIQNYVSGNLWGYSTYVPADMGYLVAMHGGVKKFENFLDRLFEQEIKMEGAQHVDISGFIGKYGHGDEPSHHMLYLYAYAGVPYKSEDLIRKVIKTMYYDAPEGLVNNDDLGQMSAWYIFSALGFYPVSPAQMTYVIGTPSVKKATMTMENGKRFTVEAKGISQKNRYIQQVILNGEHLSKSYITHKQITDGGTLLFIMGDKPNTKRGNSPDDMPLYHNGELSKVPESVICYTPFASDDTQLFCSNKRIELVCLTDGAAIRYTLNGTDPDENSPLFPPQGVDITSDTQLRARAFKQNMLPSDTYRIDLFKSAMVDLPAGYPKITLANPTTNYGEVDGRELIDGKFGAIGFGKGGWNGFTGQNRDMKVTLDLGRSIEASEFVFGYLVNSGVWIFPPRSITVSVGDSPDKLNQIVEMNRFNEPEAQTVEVIREVVKFQCQKFRYISIEATNYGPMPTWHGGSGSIPFLFIDELIFR